MPTTQVTNPVMLDSTGQSIITNLGNITSAITSLVAAVRPDATEINMGPSNSTKVASAITANSEAITTLNNKIGTIPSVTNCNSLDQVKAYLDSVFNTMSDLEVKNISFFATVSYTGGVFHKSMNYYGTMIRRANDQYAFEARNWKGETIEGGKDGSTYEFIALSNNKTNVIELQKTSVSIGQKSSWDSVYSEIANGYAGVVIIHFQNGANITGLVYKNNASYGSILGTTDDDSNPYFYAVKNGTSALRRLAYST